MSITRRSFGGLMGASFGMVALRGFALSKDSNAYFTHGVASGDPLKDRVILWTRVIPGDGFDRGIDVEWQVAADKGFAKVTSSGHFFTDASRDFTVKVDASPLEPGRQYFYRFISEGVVSPTGVTRTLPVGEVARFRIGIASCSNYPQGFFNAYRDMASQDLDAVVHLGDYIYEYPDGGYANKEALERLNRHVRPEHEILTLEDYRTRYGVYRTDQDLQKLHQKHPFICVWDDHELTNNTWKAGAENHNEGEGDFFARIRAARQAYDEWMPIRGHRDGNQGPIYRSFEIGNLADLMMLDTRFHGRDKGFEYAEDVPFRSQWYDLSNPTEVRRISASAASNLPSGSTEVLKTPFDLRSGKPEPIYDYERVKKLALTDLPRGIRYLPDFARFKDELLSDEKRTILGNDQEEWLRKNVERSVGRGAPWQILGQQVLMGKLFIPRISEKDIFESERNGRLMQMMRSMSDKSLPFNLDAWDGYPKCRDRVQDMFSDPRTNPVVLAGDTHNAWAFNMKNRIGDDFGVEIGAPGITSPGMESFIPATTETVEDSLRLSSPEIAYVDASRRGWAEATVAPDSVSARWHYVDTILDRNFKVHRTEPLVCSLGQRRFS